MATAVVTAATPRRAVTPGPVSWIQQLPVPIAMAGGLVLVDVLAVVAAIARFGRLTPNTFLLVGLAVWLIAAGDHYRPRLQLSALDDLPSIGARVVVAISIGAAYRELVSGHDVFTVDRLWVLAGAAAFVMAGRTAAYSAIRNLRRHGLLLREAVVIGSPGTRRELNEAMTRNPQYGLAPAVVGRRARTRSGLDVVIAEVTETNEVDVAQLARIASHPSSEVFLVQSALLHYPAVVPSAEYLWSIPLLRIRPVAARSLRWRVKRLLDVVVASALLVISGPVIGACALVLRLQGGPGVLFRQERVGLGGQRFTILKLRTIAAARDRDPDVVWNVGPEQLTRFARFCRATSLDELPQLWNVVRGDMSLVGPRPERPHFVAEFSDSIPEYDARHRVPAGLTGLAQVNGLRGDTSIKERAQFDNRYIDHWSLFQDLKILARTLSAMLTRRGRGS